VTTPESWSPERSTMTGNARVTLYVYVFCLIYFLTRVSIWYIFKPKIPIWVDFGGSCNRRCWYILWHLVYTYCGHLVYFSPLYKVVSGNPATMYVARNWIRVRSLLLKPSVGSDQPQQVHIWPYLSSSCLLPCRQ
jgi:hypothetical protein